MKRNLYKQLIAALCLAISLAGCMKEDWNDCEGVYLAFECINPEYTFPGAVSELELLFYYPAGGLAYDLSYTSSQLAADNWRVNLTRDLPQTGLYTVVALVNYHTETPLSIFAKTEKRTFLAEIEYDNKRWVNYTVTDSYHGIYELDFSEHNGETIVHTVPLSKNTNTIKLTVEFTDPEDARQLTRYNSYLRGENARYRWNYTIPPHQPVYYKPYNTAYDAGAGIFRDYHKTMRLHADGNLSLHLEFEEAGSPLHSRVLNIPELLARVEKNGVRLYDTNEKLEYHDYFEITLLIGKGFVIAGIIVNEWYLVVTGEDI